MGKQMKKYRRAVVDMTFRMNQLDKLDLRAFIDLLGATQGRYINVNRNQAFTDHTLAAILTSNVTGIRRITTDLYLDEHPDEMITFEGAITSVDIGKAAEALYNIRDGRLPYFMFDLDDPLLNRLVKSGDFEPSVSTIGYTLQDLRKTLCMARAGYQAAMGHMGTISDANIDFVHAHRALKKHVDSGTTESPSGISALSVYKSEVVRQAFAYEYFKRNNISTQDDIESARARRNRNQMMSCDTVDHDAIEVKA